MRLHASAPSQIIPIRPLTGRAFQDFGQVVENPGTHDDSLPHTVIQANQGSATKVLDVTNMLNHYELSQSRRPARPVMNMFICKPRKLKEQAEGKAVFQVQILERHPFTPQTFIPLGLNKKDREMVYLVIVAPTLPLSPRPRSEVDVILPYPGPAPRRKRSLRERLLGTRPNLFTNDFAPSTTPAVTVDLSPSIKPKGPGMPDLTQMRAFIARGDQAVTYGPGTWHAPMVVLGKRELEFVVVQFANGVDVEDCQEVELVNEDGGQGLEVLIEDDGLLAGPKAKL